jgi:hypothetical protein
MEGESKAQIHVYIVSVLACSLLNVTSVTCSAASQAVVSTEFEMA